MTAPQTGARLTLEAALLGAVLGLMYSFLRPLRPRHTAAADTLFVLAALAAYIDYSFARCAGDIRPGAAAVMIACGVCAEWLLFRRFVRVYALFWRAVAFVARLFWFPAKKILLLAKKMFAFGRKWGTIKENNRRGRRVSGGSTHGGAKASARKAADHSAPQLSRS